MELELDSIEDVWERDGTFFLIIRTVNYRRTVPTARQRRTKLQRSLSGGRPCGNSASYQSLLTGFQQTQLLALKEKEAGRNQ